MPLVVGLTLVSPQGFVEVALPQNGQWVVARPDLSYTTTPGSPAYEEMRASLDGGWLEYVTSRLIPGYGLYVDEEGLLKDLPFNAIASAVVGQAIHGPAVILTLDDVRDQEVASLQADDQDDNEDPDAPGSNIEMGSCTDCPHLMSCVVSQGDLCDDRASTTATDDVVLEDANCPGGEVV